MLRLVLALFAVTIVAEICGQVSFLPAQINSARQVDFGRVVAVLVLDCDLRSATLVTLTRLQAIVVCKK